MYERDQIREGGKIRFNEWNKNTVRQPFTPRQTSPPLCCVSASSAGLSISLTEEAGQGDGTASRGYPHPAA